MKPMLAVLAYLGIGTASCVYWDRHFEGERTPRNGEVVRAGLLWPIIWAVWPFRRRLSQSCWLPQEQQS